jgi:hypothetical protein
VHLAAPKQSVFVRDRVPTKASVIITRAPGEASLVSQCASHHFLGGFQRAVSGARKRVGGGQLRHLDERDVG